MQKIGEYVVTSLSAITAVRGREIETGMWADAYRDAAKMTAFCQDELTRILSNNKGSDDLSSEEINDYLFAKLQDRLRFMLRIKRLPTEDRSDYVIMRPVR